MSTASTAIGMGAPVAVRDAAMAPECVLWGLAAAMGLSFLVHVEPAPFDVLVAALLVGGVITGLRAGTAWVTAGACLLVLMTASIVSLAFAPALIRGISFHMKTVYCIAIFLLVVFCINTYGPRATRLVLAGHAVGALASFAAVLAGIAGLLPVSQVLRLGRATAFFKDPNVTGPYLAVGAVYLLHLALEQERTRTRVAAAALFCIVASTLVASMSRAAWLNFAAAAAVYSVALVASSSTGRQALQRISRITVVAALGVVVAVGVAAPVLAEIDIAGRLGLQAYDADRFATWARAAEGGLVSPLGVGPGQSEIVFDYAAHSLYARLFAEQGAIGLGAMLAFLGLSLVRAAGMSRRGVTYAPVVLGLIVGLMVNSIFVDTLHWRHLWVVVALAWADS